MVGGGEKITTYKYYLAIVTIKHPCKGCLFVFGWSFLATTLWPPFNIFLISGCYLTIFSSYIP